MVDNFYKCFKWLTGLWRIKFLEKIMQKVWRIIIYGNGTDKSAQVIRYDIYNI